MYNVFVYILCIFLFIHTLVSIYWASLNEIQLLLSLFYTWYQRRLFWAIIFTSQNISLFCRIIFTSPDLSNLCHLLFDFTRSVPLSPELFLLYRNYPSFASIVISLPDLILLLFPHDCLAKTSKTKNLHPHLVVRLFPS